MDKHLKKGMIVVFVTNVINLIFNLLINFLMPKYLSVNNYALIKTFQLYSAYVGLLHFGYVDAVYLKYGGKNITQEIDEAFSENLSTMRIFQLIVSIVFIIISIYMQDILLILFSLTILPVNMANYFKFLYQATGEFIIYGKIMNMSTFLLFFINMFWIIFFRNVNAIFIIVSYVFIYYLINVILEFQFYMTYRVSKPLKLFSIRELVISVKKGIYLTVGNLASLFLSTMDRWFVKIFLNVIDFAHYSFAVSVQGFLNVAITPITTTLYNYFCKEKETHKIIYIYNLVTLFGVLLCSSVFIIKFILEFYLVKYKKALIVIVLLFSTQMFNVVINGVFVNLYKAQSKQKTYFIKLVFILTVAAILNFLFYYFYPYKESFAFATLVSTILWFLISIKDFPCIYQQKKSMLFLFVELFFLIFFALKFLSIIGFILYIVTSVIVMILIMPDIINEILTKLKLQIKLLKGVKS